MMCLLAPLFLSLIFLSAGLLIDLNNRELVLNLCIAERLNKMRGLTAPVAMHFERILEREALNWNNQLPEIEVKKEETEVFRNAFIQSESNLQKSIVWLQIKNISPLAGGKIWNLKCGVIQKKQNGLITTAIVADKF